MQLFYSTNIKNNTVTLDATDSKHCCQVLRKRVGDKVQIIDGLGNFYHCTIQTDDRLACVLAIEKTEINFGVRPQNLHLAIAPTKKLDKIEWFVEKAIEIGVETISFIATQHSEKMSLKMDRMEKIAISAIKQSGRAQLPILNNMVALPQFLQAHKNSAAQKFIAYVPENNLHFKNAYLGGEVITLIGPEGGFSEKEVQICVQSGFAPVSLGNFRLRTETAGVVVCSLVAV